MYKLRVGVWLLDDYKPTIGGGFGYYSEMVEAISRYSFSHADVVFLGSAKQYIKHIGEKPVYQILWEPARVGVIERMIRLLATKGALLPKWKVYYRKQDKKREDALIDELYQYCDLIYYLTPNCRFSTFPYIYTLWDLGHVSTFAFPELTYQGRFESRKTHHDYLPHKALMVFCETEVGKGEAVAYLNINPARIRMLPMIPGVVVHPQTKSVRPAKMEDNMLFIHYPAQYWAHKNHVTLLRGFKEVTKRNPVLRLVLTGSDQGNYAFVRSKVKELDLEDAVVDLGFVSSEELKWLYQHSKGLVMPTLLGPSNMPPIEGLALGCPVAVSDLPGHRELLGNSAIYFNPLDYLDIAKAIEQVLKITSVIPVDIPTADKNMPLLDTYFAELSIVRGLWGKQ